MKLLKFFKLVLMLLFEEFVKPIITGYRIFMDKRAFRRACRNADYLSEVKNGMKHVVLKDYNGDYVIINRNNFLMMRLPRRGQFDRNVKWEDVLREANYITR